MSTPRFQRDRQCSVPIRVIDRHVVVGQVVEVHPSAVAAFTDAGGAP